MTKHKIPPLSDSEEAMIQRQIAADSDAPEITAAEALTAIPAAAFFTPGQLDALMQRKRGERGKGRKPAKVAISLRLNPVTLEAFKAKGDGWQQRIDAALSRFLREHPDEA